MGRTCIPDPSASGDAAAGSPDAAHDAGNGSDAGEVNYQEPVAYWAFDQDDIAGSVLTARLGGLSGTVAGPVPDPGGVVADAFAFGGGAHHVDFACVLDDVFAGPDRRFSISVWIKPAAVSSPQSILVKAGASFPYDIQPTAAHLALGNIIGAGGSRCGDEELVGSLDELAVWDSVLSADDAVEVHARGMAAQPVWPP